VAIDEGRRRLLELDVMRGVAIVAVVYLHAYFKAWPGVPPHEVLALHAIHLFAHGAVPVFLFVSGFLLAREHATSAGDFAWRKLRRIYVPLLIWMGVALAYRAYQQGGMSVDLLRSLALFDISGQYYYLAVLLLLSVIFYCIGRTRFAGSVAIPAVAFVLNLAAIAYYQHVGVSGTGLASVLAYRNPLIWVFFFSFGLFLGRRAPSLAWTERYLWPGLAAMGGIAVLYFVIGERYAYPVSYFGVQVFLFSCCGLVCYPAMIRRMLRSGLGATLLAPVRWLSLYAFSIYLVHMPLFIGWLTLKTVTEPGYFSNDYMKLMTALFVVGLGGALTFSFVVAHLLRRSAPILIGMQVRDRVTSASGEIAAAR
jgi:peptidoglycan/LPS O-acetylase OafA/YrhL